MTALQRGLGNRAFIHRSLVIDSRGDSTRSSDSCRARRARAVPTQPGLAATSAPSGSADTSPSERSRSSATTAGVVVHRRARSKAVRSGLVTCTPSTVVTSPAARSLRKSRTPCCGRRRPGREVQTSTGSSTLEATSISGSRPSNTRSPSVRPTRRRSWSRAAAHPPMTNPGGRPDAMTATRVSRSSSAVMAGTYTPCRTRTYPEPFSCHRLTPTVAA